MRLVLNEAGSEDPLERFKRTLAALVGEIGNDGLNWPHCDGFIWPHVRPIVS